MWNEPTEEELKKLPRLYATENVPIEKKIIRMHFFLGCCGCDWYAAEYDPKKRIFFGFVILGRVPIAATASEEEVHAAILGSSASNVEGLRRPSSEQVRPRL